MTIAVATCDRPTALMRCLAAILAGEVLPEELITIDQSKDEAVADALATLPPSPISVRHLRQTRQGLSASRNCALAAASTPIVAFTDDDCVPSEGWLLTIHRVLAQDQELAAVTGQVLPLGEESPGTYAVSSRASTEPRVYRGRAVPWHVGTGGNFAAKREWLEQIRGFDHRLGAGSPGRAAEDADVMYRLLAAGARIKYEPESVVYHERQTAAQRLASRFGYAYGIGAVCALYLRSGDLYGGIMLGSYLKALGVGLIRAVARRDWFLTRQRIQALQGCAGGLAYGLRVR
jgi:GT2 family glycosyltransferase